MMRPYELPLAIMRERQARTNSTWRVGRLEVDVREVDGPFGHRAIRVRVRTMHGRANPGAAGAAAFAVALEIFKDGCVGHLDALEGKTRESGEATVYTAGFFSFSGDPRFRAMQRVGGNPEVTRLS